MILHTVEKGDTLYKLSRRYGVSAQKIAADNGISSPDELTVGQSLIILTPTKTYIVRRGDTLFDIARRFNTSVLKLWRNNPALKGKSDLTPGQPITISYSPAEYGAITTNGYAFPSISREVLRATLPYLTYLSIFSYSINADGTLRAPDDDELISISKQYNTLPVLVLTSLSENGGFSESLVTEFLQNKESQDKTINELHKLLKKKGYSGVDVDFEYIGKNNANSYTEFIKNLRQRICPDGFFVFVDLPPKTSEEQSGTLYEGQIYKDIGESANAVMLMTYEWGYTYSPPMAVAPIDKVRKVAEFAVEEIPCEKVTLGIPSYGYIWQLPYEETSRAKNIPSGKASNIAYENKTSIQFDEKAQTPFFTFYEKEGEKAKENIAYFEDARSIKAKLELAHELGLKGVGYWTIMNFFTQNWVLLNSMFDIVKGYDVSNFCHNDF